MCQCTSNPRLSDAGRPDDEDAEVFADPAPVGQRQDEVLVEPTGRAEVDVLDACIVSEPGAPEPVGELSGVSLGELAVDEEPEAFLERQVLDLGRGELLGHRLGHAGASELVELVHGGMSQHVGVLSGVIVGAADVVVLDRSGGSARVGARRGGG